MKRGIMRKREFVNRCAAESNLSQRQMTDILELISSLLKQELVEEGSVQCFGLGKLSVVQRTSKKHHNFKTGELYPARSYKTVKFTANSDIKNLINDQKE